MTSSLQDPAAKLDSLIRKLKKKLRQIENLERLNRSLTYEETVKLANKNKIREALLAAVDKKTPEYLYEVGGPETEYEEETQVESSEQEHHLRKPEEPATCSSDHSCDKGTVVNKKAGKGDLAKGDSTQERHQFPKSYCCVSVLEGHSDVINALVVVGDRVVTASRDTTLKYWDVFKGTQIRNFGGHTGSVTCLLVHEDAAGQVVPEKENLLISGSMDCTIKFWSLQAGNCIKSVYTFSPITKVAYCIPLGQVITGSEGGKLELWDVVTGENAHSCCAHTGSVTGLKISDKLVYSSGADSVIKVHRVAEEGQLECLFVSESLKTITGARQTSRPVRCLDVYQNLIVYGDDARNVKILDWKKGVVTKVPNNESDFSVTDALVCYEDFLISSAYDMDVGLGYLNVHSLQTKQYLTTIDDCETERIVCLGCGRTSSNDLFFVTGEMGLKLWEIMPATKPKLWEELEKELFFEPEVRSALTGRPVDSEESSSDDGSDIDEADLIIPSELTDYQDSKGRWLSWCNVL